MQPRSVISSNFNGLPLVRPASTTFSNIDEYKVDPHRHPRRLNTIHARTTLNIPSFLIINSAFSQNANVDRLASSSAARLLRCLNNLTFIFPFYSGAYTHCALPFTEIS